MCRSGRSPRLAPEATRNLPGGQAAAVFVDATLLAKSGVGGQVVLVMPWVVQRWWILVGGRGVVGVVL